MITIITIKEEQGMNLRLLTIFFLFLYFANANELENILEKKEQQKEKNDMQFEELLKNGLEKHPSISMMNEAIKVANSSVNSAEWSFFPTPSIDIAQKGSITQTTARLDQPIWTGGKLTSAYDKAIAKKDEIQVSLEESKYSLIESFINVLQSYLVAKAQIEALTNGKNDLLEFVSMLERRIEAGASSQSDMFLLKSRISQIDSDLVVAKSKFELSKSQFEILSSIKVNNITTSLTSKISKPLDIEEYISKLKAFSPQIKALETQVKTAEYEVDSAKARFMPNLSLRAEHTKGSIYDETDNNGQNLIYLSLSANTGAGLTILSEIEGARAKVMQLKFQQQTKEKELIEVLVTEYNSMMASYNKSLSLKNTISSSQKVLESYSRLFVAGKKQWLDLVNASKELMQNNQELASQEAMVKILKYKFALTVGDIDLGNGELKNDL